MNLQQQAIHNMPK